MFDQIDPETETETASAVEALKAFSRLVHRTNLDGQTCAVLAYNTQHLAHHQLDLKPGDQDYWRNRLDQIQWPTGLVGRPAQMEAGHRRNIYIDDPSWQEALMLGNRNASEGIRVALSNLVSGRERKEEL